MRLLLSMSLVSAVALSASFVPATASVLGPQVSAKLDVVIPVASKKKGQKQQQGGTEQRVRQGLQKNMPAEYQQYLGGGAGGAAGGAGGAAGGAGGAAGAAGGLR